MLHDDNTVACEDKSDSRQFRCFFIVCLAAIAAILFICMSESVAAESIEIHDDHSSDRAAGHGISALATWVLPGALLTVFAVLAFLALRSFRQKVSPSPRGKKKHRFLSLRSRVVLIIILSQMALIVFFVIPLVNSQHRILESQLKGMYEAHLDSIVHFIGPKIKKNDLGQIEAYLEDLKKDEYTRYCVLYDQKGERLRGWGEEDLSDFNPDSPMWSPGSPETIFRELSPLPSGIFHTEGHIYDWIVPLFAGSDLVGYLNLGINSAVVNRYVAATTKRGIWVTLLAICAGAILALWVDRQMRRTLVQLIGVTSRMAEGDLSRRVKISTGDELELLGGSFNRMADALQEHETELVRARETLEETVMERTAELRASQSALVQHEKLAGVGQLAAGVSHEINTPITTIITSSQFLLEDISDPECKRDIERIRSEALRCKEIVENLLEFSRKSDQEKETMDLRTVAQKATALIRHDMELQGIELLESHDNESLLVFGCENELVQVIFNLLQNAKDSMPDGGEVRIETRTEPDGLAMVVVADTGLGILPWEQSKIFDPFFTTKEVGQGTGLGLSISYRIIEDHQGKIRLVKSDANGTTFEIILPRKDTAES